MLPLSYRQREGRFRTSSPDYPENPEKPTGRYPGNDRTIPSHRLVDAKKSTAHFPGIDWSISWHRLVDILALTGQCKEWPEPESPESVRNLFINSFIYRIMLNYSIAMRSNPIDKGAPKKAYATSQYSEVMNINQFAEHIASHGSVYKRSDVAAILTMAVDCLREQLLEGKKVELGDLGFFYVRISGEGAPSAAEYNPAIYVKKLNVKWQCGARFKDLLGEAVFNLVAPRSVSQKVLKAHKAGETTVDISPEVTEEETDDQGGMGV